MLQSDEYDEAKARELATLKKTGPAKRLARYLLGPPTKDPSCKA